MADHKDREQYIPVRKSDLVQLLCEDRGVTPDQAVQIRKMADMLAATFHFEYHHRLEELKDEYSPFDPDTVTREVFVLSAEERQGRLDGLFERFAWLLQRANYSRLDKAAIEEATRAVSDWGLNMEVDFALFEKLEVWARGDVIGERCRRKWYRFFRLECLQVPTFQRMVIMVKLRPSPRLPGDIDIEDVFIKLFKDIPKMDMEMLLPGARMQMPRLTRFKLGGSLLSGLGYVAYTIMKQVLLTGVVLSLWFFWGPIVALFGYGYRQWYGYQSAKTMHTLQLTQSLYYQNLGNNLGVLQHLLDEAEEQEVREALLAYVALWRSAGEQGWTAEELDDFVEMELERLADLKVDFEIGDAMEKLERLRLVTRAGDRFTAVPIDQALANLDQAWDNYFDYNQAEGNRPSPALAESPGNHGPNTHHPEA